jgi:hypothetical protein
MNGFLVVHRHPSDDVPVGLYRTLDEAREHAHDQPSDVMQTKMWGGHDGFDPDGSIWIIEFVDGRPVAARCLDPVSA